MIRRVFMVVAALSLVLCTGASSLWVRSYWRRDHIEFTYKGQRWEVASNDARYFVDNEPQIALEAAEQQAALSAAQNVLQNLRQQMLRELPPFESVLADHNLEIEDLLGPEGYARL